MQLFYTFIFWIKASLLYLQLDQFYQAQKIKLNKSFTIKYLLYF